MLTLSKRKKLKKQKESRLSSAVEVTSIATRFVVPTQRKQVNKLSESHGTTNYTGMLGEHKKKKRKERLLKTDAG